VVFLKDGYIWTHGHFINGTGIADSVSSNATISWSKITDKPSTFTPSAHTQSYTTLTGSGTTANQAIVSSGTANGWTLKTLGSRAFDSTSYLPLAGGTLTGNLAFSGDNSITWSRNTDYAKIHFKNTGDGDSDSYLGFETADNGNEYFRFGHRSGGYTEWMSIKSDGVRVKGTKVSLEGHNHNDLYVSSLTTSGNYLRWVKNGSNNDITIPYATNADTVDSLHASDIARFYLSPMTSGAPADSAKSWFINTMPSDSGAIVYNVPGSEKTIIAGKSSGSYGHMLQLNYDDTYLRILRYYQGSWKSSDWEKISAGYADSAGSATYASSAGSVAWGNVTGKPSSFTPSSHNHDGSYIKRSGDDVTGHYTFRGRVFGYNYNNQGNNAAAFMWDKPGSYYTGMGPNGVSNQIHFGPCNADGTWVSSFSQQWEFQGNVYASNFYTTSDQSKKTNIESIASIIPIRKFNWKENGSLSYGFIAQELVKLGYNELVSGTDGSMTVNYNAALSLSVAKLSNYIEKLENTVKELQYEVKILKGET